jgi:hypothetical protein
MAVIHMNERTMEGNWRKIDRSTRWGNPFRIGADGTRDEVIARYRVHLWSQIRSGEVSIEDLADLHHCDLACYCAPKPCHGDVLAAAATWAKTQLSA